MAGKGPISSLASFLGDLKDAVTPRTLSVDKDALQNNIENYGLGSSQYNFKSRTFPEDLNSDYNGHYVVININVPATDGNILGNIWNNAASRNTSFSQTLSGAQRNELSKVDRLRFGTYGGFGPTNTTGLNPLAGAWARASGTRRIVESIAIYMPTGITNFNSQHLYEEISLTSIAGQAGKLVAQAAGAGLMAKIGGAAMGLTAAGRLGSVADGAGRVIGTAAKLMGYPINPRAEVIFSTTPQRQFRMEILMAPKNENESLAMKGIIETLRFHAAPELTTFGLEVNNIGIGIPLYIPPAQFDISFFNKGQENRNIPRINTCVIDAIEVDYAPTGIFSTFRNGHPVTARLSIGFREVEILHKTRIAQGF